MADGSSGGAGDWCTIESDPGVFTELLETLGCEHVQLEELWTLEDDSLQALRDSTNNQIYGLIFLFQWQSEIQRQHAANATSVSMDNTTGNGDGAGGDATNDLFFAHQVTTNACATQAILSVVLNTENLTLGKTLSEFKEFTKDFPPQLKGMSISSSNDIRTAHNSFGRSGEAMFLDPELRAKNRASASDEVYHFVAYIPKNNKVYELDGLQSNPIEVGTIPDEASTNTNLDWLSVAREAIQLRMTKQSDIIKFNLMAVCLDKRIPLQKVLEIDQSNESAKYTLKLEEEKRLQWKLENQRRKHNYVPFCIQLLKELAKQTYVEEPTKKEGGEGESNGETNGNGSKPMLKRLYEQAKERKQKQRTAALASKKK